MRAYRPLSHIHVDDVLSYKEIYIASDAGEEVESAFCKMIATFHDQSWVPGKPSWRVVVSKVHRHEDQELCKVYVTFLSHHALADGLSCLVFHKSLLKYLRLTASESSAPQVVRAHWPLCAPLDLQPPPAVEDLIQVAIKSSQTMLEIRDEVLTDNGELPWGGNLISTSNVYSRIRMIIISPSDLIQLLKLCKANSISLTGFIHGVINLSLSRTITNAKSFRAVTPYSLRHLTGASGMVNHIAYTTTKTALETLQALRKVRDGSKQELDIILCIAKAFQVTLAQQIADFPRGSVLEALNAEPDLEAGCANVEGKEREYTYELSNLGVFDDGSSIMDASASAWDVEKVIFTQCAMVAGPALGFSCVSLKKGGLIIGISWQDGIVCDETVNGVAEKIRKALNHYAGFKG